MIGAYHRRVAEAVRRFDGFVAKYMGDGVLVYFGYPAAHEDDADARGSRRARHERDHSSVDPAGAAPGAGGHRDWPRRRW